MLLGCNAKEEEELINQCYLLVSRTRPTHVSRRPPHSKLLLAILFGACGKVQMAEMKNASLVPGSETINLSNRECVFVWFKHTLVVQVLEAGRSMG